MVDLGFAFECLALFDCLLFCYCICAVMVVLLCGVAFGVACVWFVLLFGFIVWNRFREFVVLRLVWLYC